MASWHTSSCTSNCASRLGIRAALVVCESLRDPPLVPPCSLRDSLTPQGPSHVRMPCLKLGPGPAMLLGAGRFSRLRMGASGCALGLACEQCNSGGLHSMSEQTGASQDVQSTA